MLGTGAPVDVTGATTAAQGRAQRAFGDFLNQSAESFGALNLGSSSAVQAARGRKAQDLSNMIAETGMMAEIQAAENAQTRRMQALGEERSGQELNLQRLLGQGGLELEGQRIRGSNLAAGLQGAGGIASRANQARLGAGNLALRGAGMMSPFRSGGGGEVAASPSGFGSRLYATHSGGGSKKRYNTTPMYTYGGKTYSESQVMSSKRPSKFKYHAPGSYQMGTYADGGIIPGQGPPDGEDNILAAVRSGELIVPEDLTKKIMAGTITGEKLIAQLQALADNSNDQIDFVSEFACGGIPHFARGGAPWMVDGMAPWQAERVKDKEREFENFLANYGAERSKNFTTEMALLGGGPEERRRVQRQLAIQSLGGEESAMRFFSDPELQKEARAAGEQFVKDWRGAPQVRMPSALDESALIDIGYSRLRTEGKPLKAVRDQSAEAVEQAIRQQAAAGSPKAQKQVAAMDFDPKQAAADLREQQWRTGREEALTGMYERSNQRMADRRFNERAIEDIMANLGPGGQPGLGNYVPQYAEGGIPSYQDGGVPWWAMYENMEETEDPGLPDIYQFLKEFSPQEIEGPPVPPTAPGDPEFMGPMQQEAATQPSYSITGAEGQDVLAEGLAPGQETQFGTTRGKGRGGLSVMGVEESELEKQRRRRDLANARVDLLSSYMMEKPTPRLAQALRQAQVEAGTANSYVQATEKSLIEAQNAMNDAKLREAQWKTAEANYARATAYTPKDELDALKLELTRVASGLAPREGEDVPTEEDIAGARAVLKIAEKDPMSATMMTQILKLGDANLINMMFNQMGWDVSARYPNIVDRIKSFVTGSPGISNNMILEPGGQLNTTDDALAKRRAELNDIFMQLAQMQGQGQQ
jgi:hypothetical protein